MVLNLQKQVKQLQARHEELRLDGVINRCIDQMLVDGDGGDAAMDRTVADGTTFHTLDTTTTGFTSWERDGEARGKADWVIPQGCTDFSRRMLFIHGGKHLTFRLFRT